MCVYTYFTIFMQITSQNLLRDLCRLILCDRQRTSSVCNFHCEETLNQNTNKNELDEVWNCADCRSTTAADRNLSQSQHPPPQKVQYSDL